MLPPVSTVEIWEYGLEKRKGAEGTGGGYSWRLKRQASHVQAIVADRWYTRGIYKDPLAPLLGFKQGNPLSTVPH